MSITSVAIAVHQRATPSGLRQAGEATSAKRSLVSGRGSTGSELAQKFEAKAASGKAY